MSDRNGVYQKLVDEYEAQGFTYEEASKEACENLKYQYDYYEVQTKFVYGWENCWKDDDEKEIFFDTKEEANEEIKNLVDGWNNDSNTTEKLNYSDYRVVGVFKVEEKE